MSYNSTKAFFKNLNLNRAKVKVRYQKDVDVAFDRNGGDNLWMKGLSQQ